MKNIGKMSSISAKLFSCLILTVFLVTGYTAIGKPSGKNKAVFKLNKRLGRGINVSGYGGLDLADYKAIKDAGFFNVRIPIHPFNQSIGDSLFTLKPEFFATLDKTIENSLANNIIPIVDFHEHGAMQKDPMGTKPMFLAMWKQIAEHLKDAPKDVLFEIANEPNMKAETWNMIHSEAYKIIRESNPDRTLLIGTINGNQIKFLNDLVLPENDRNIIITIHYYMPIQFTHQGAEWSPKNRDLHDISWPGAEGGEPDITKDFEMAQEWSKTHNRPLHLGEFGTYNKGDMESRVRWTAFVAREAEKYNWSWSYWELYQGFGIYSRNDKIWKQGLLKALIP
jgi:endoglucanase